MVRFYGAFVSFGGGMVGALVRVARMGKNGFLFIKWAKFGLIEFDIGIVWSMNVMMFVGES